MKNLKVLISFICVALIFMSCAENNPFSPENNKSDDVVNTLEKKAATSILGYVETPFSFDNPPIFWKGTIDFGERGIYGIKFISYDPPKEYSQASPYNEDFIIFDLEDETEETIYLKGSVSGVVTYANKDPEPVKFHSNGKVVEAYGDFEEWIGRSVHIKGLVYWISVGVPKVSKGYLRIN